MSKTIELELIHVKCIAPSTGVAEGLNTFATLVAAVGTTTAIVATGTGNVPVAVAGGAVAVLVGTTAWLGNYIGGEFPDMVYAKFGDDRFWPAGKALDMKAGDSASPRVKTTAKADDGQVTFRLRENDTIGSDDLLVRLDFDVAGMEIGHECRLANQQFAMPSEGSVYELTLNIKRLA